MALNGVFDVSGDVNRDFDRSGEKIEIIGLTDGLTVYLLCATMRATQEKIRSHPTEDAR